MWLVQLQGARRFGSEEAPPIDWIVPPARRASSSDNVALSEMFAYHATTMVRSVARFDGGLVVWHWHGKAMRWHGSTCGCR